VWIHPGHVLSHRARIIHLFIGTLASASVAAPGVEELDPVTRVSGVRIVAAPCCGAQYAQPRYSSMNFSAREYWTDGWREASLMPNDAGLRRCRCGRLVTLGDLVEISTAPESDLPLIDRVPDEDLTGCLNQTLAEDVELAIRRQLWWYLNHPYRKLYRQHRDEEDAATQAAWEAANPDRRTWWDKLLRRELPRYVRQAGRPFTCPPFEPSPEQLGNLERLASILRARREVASNVTTRTELGLELAELCREQGQFEAAEAALSGVDADEAGGTGKLTADLIRERLAAPVRYRL